MSSWDPLVVPVMDSSKVWSEVREQVVDQVRYLVKSEVSTLVKTLVRVGPEEGIRDHLAACLREEASMFPFRGRTLDLLLGVPVFREYSHIGRQVKGPLRGLVEQVEHAVSLVIDGVSYDQLWEVAWK